MTELVLVNIPRMSPSPHFGMTLLCKKLKENCIDHVFFDANLDLYQQYYNTDHWPEIERFGIAQLSRKSTSVDLWNVIQDAINHWADTILSYSPRIVGISVFTHESRNWTQWLCYAIRSRNPRVEILLGGKGISDPGVGNASFAQECKAWRLCDHWINGESEISLIEYILYQTPVVDNPNSYVLENIDFYDFSVIDQKNYNIVSNWYGGFDNAAHTGHTLSDTDNEPSLKTYATRGCVKMCTFCDVHLLRPKFSMRSPQNLFDEIRSAIENHGIKKIMLTDDMVNGSNRQFMQWQSLLAQYLQDNKISGFRWGSQFGIKSKLSTPIEMFNLLSMTGAQLTIGFDHFSNDVLEHMQKKYTVDDIFWHLENFYDKNILCTLAMFVLSYPTETKKDFEIFLQYLTEFSKYQKIIELINLGTTCNIPQGSILEKIPGMILGQTQISWNYSFNPDLDIEEKKRRRIEAECMCDKLGLTVRKKRTEWMRIESWTKS